MYIRDRFIELESLSPLAELSPGDSLTHDESWEIYLAARPESEAEILKWIQRLSTT